MAYTEIKQKNNKKYYYRVKSVRKGKKITKKRVYLGLDLKKDVLKKKEGEADRELKLLSSLLGDEEIKILDKVKKEYIQQPKENIENRYEAFCSLFAYDSTNIEGNTLTLQETSQLLFENRTPIKSLREINEVVNHKEAFDYLLSYNKDIDKKFILEIHRLVTKNTLREELSSQIGKYRTVQVYIRGVEWLPPKPEQVSREMGSLLRWYSNNKGKLHPLILSAYFHSAFETIHPFVDGNGRVGRLLLNFILHKNKFPMINIPNKEKHRYYIALENARIEGNLKTFIEFLMELLKIC